MPVGNVPQTHLQGERVSKGEKQNRNADTQSKGRHRKTHSVWEKGQQGVETE